jgi:ethanolamine utilization protein EutA
MGAAQHTVQVSGNTIYCSDEKLLPQKNLQVLRPEVDLSDEIISAKITEAIEKHFRAFDLTEGQTQVALVFRWDGPPTAIRIAAFCRGMIDGLAETLKTRRPIYLVFDRDLARLIGRILRDDFAIESPLLCIDGVTLSDFDFIDLGKTLEPSGTVPVTIKSLVFQF